VVDLSATDLIGDDRQSLGTSVIMRDITERKHRDDEIRRLNASLNEQVMERTAELAEKVEQLAQVNRELQNLDRMRAEFVSVVSHQIRAPLTNMRGAIERLRTGCAMLNNVCDRMFAVLEQQVDRLDRLVQDVLNASRIEAGELVLHVEPMSVLPVVQEVIEQTRARTDNRSFNVLTKPGLPFVLADRDRVTEVLANLLDNADKYSPPGEEILIEMRADQTDVTVTVRDKGCGIRSGDLDRIFEKFYRVDNSDSQLAYGHGLGLYICRQLVGAQGGRIWAENVHSGGALFSFTLPAVNDWSS
jgi:signal transduction histidine kinase